MLTFPDRVPLALLPTPFQRLSRYSEKLGVNLWIKRDDLSGLTLSGNKVRKLEFTLRRAMDEGCDTIITCGGLQSNHCRATAFAGAQLGLKVCLVLRGSESGARDGNLMLDELAGADINTYPPSQYRHELRALLNAKVQELTEQGRKPFVIPTGASDGHGIWGYVAACSELLDDFNANGIEPAHIVCATGSGGTQAGLTLGMHILAPHITVTGFAVCDDKDYFRNKVLADIRQWSRWYGQPLDPELLRIVVNDRYVGPGYAQAGPEIYQAIRELASTEGVVLDPVYTGKAFYGLLSEIEAGRWDRGTDIVFVHTGGIFGNFPHRERFQDTAQ